MPGLPCLTATSLTARPGLVELRLDAVGRLIVASRSADRATRALQRAVPGGRFDRRLVAPPAVALPLAAALALLRLAIGRDLRLLAPTALALLSSLPLSLRPGFLLRATVFLSLLIAALVLWASL